MNTHFCKKLLIMMGVLCSITFVSTQAANDYSDPSASPIMRIETENGKEEFNEYTGSAPIKAFFEANVENVGDYTPLYEWHVYKDGKTDAPYLVRYDADFNYEFRETGQHGISLTISFVNNGDTISYKMETDFTVSASSSVLNVPNAFSPNGDGTNDTFGVKDDYKSIVEFKGYIFNRYGTKLFEFKNITDRWDGTYKGHDVPDGAYFVKIEAKGADGRHYNIKKAVNILRGYTYNSTGGGGN